MKHTPGPWTDPRCYTEPNGDIYRATVYCGGDGRAEKLRAAATLSTPDETDLANLHLIAAAPELLEICRIAHDAILGVTEAGWDISTLKPYQYKLRFVIDKAKGK